MDNMLSYGIGASAGVAEHYILKKIFPASPNMATAIVGAAPLLGSLFGWVPTQYKDLATANGVTMVIIAGLNAVTNPQATGVRLRVN